MISSSQAHTRGRETHAVGNPLLVGQDPGDGNWNPGHLDAGFLGLFIVQFVGVCLAIRLTSQIPDLYGHEIGPNVHFQMRVAVWILLLVTIAGAAVQGDLLRLVWVGFGAATKAKAPNLRNLEKALVVYFFADFVAIAFLLAKTGGPEHSIYTTFLYVLVPITIAFQRRVRARTVSAFALMTMIVFLATLWTKPFAVFSAQSNFEEAAIQMRPAGVEGVTGADPSAEVTRQRRRKCWMSAITIACVLFPTVIYLMQRRCPGCLHENGFGERDPAPQAPEAARPIGGSAGQPGPGDLAERMFMSDGEK